MLLWELQEDYTSSRFYMIYNMNHVQSVNIIAIPLDGVQRFIPWVCGPHGIFPNTSMAGGISLIYMYTSWPWFIY